MATVTYKNQPAISCLLAEGVELYPKSEIYEAIKRETKKLERSM